MRILFILLIGQLFATDLSEIELTALINKTPEKINILTREQKFKILTNALNNSSFLMLLESIGPKDRILAKEILNYEKYLWNRWELLNEDEKSILQSWLKTLPNQGPHFLSDIDDTTISVLNDSRFSKGTLYPGVCQLHQLVPTSYFTARPSFLAYFTNRSLAPITKKPEVYYGNFSDLLSKKSMAHTKMLNLHKFSLLNPEYNLVFIGDNGQGDISTGKILQTKCMTGFFIHNLGDREEKFVSREFTAFNTYIGFSIFARQQKYLTELEQNIVIRDALQEDPDLLKHETSEICLLFKDLTLEQLASNI